MISDQMWQRSLKVAPGGVHSPVRSFKDVAINPLFFKRGQGAYLTDVDEQKYIDYCMAFGPLILGHTHPEILAKASEALKDGWCFGACEPYSLALAEKMIQLLGYVDKVRFVSSGTEAVMSALRLARGATGRAKILKFEGCYHGHSDSLLVKAGSGLINNQNSQTGFVVESSQGITPGVLQDTLVCPLDDEESLEKIFKTMGEQIAAVIIEPLPANCGLLLQRQAFLQKIRSLTQQYGSLLILDEVISGFRVGLKGMGGICNIVPDLVTFGKVMGGGANAACYAGKKEYMDLIAPSGPVYQAGTLSASPLTMQMGLKTLEYLDENQTIPTLNKRVETWVEDLKTRLPQEKMELIHYGSIFWFHFSPSSQIIRKPSQITALQNQKFSHFFRSCLKQGVYLPPSGFEVMFVSAAHSDEILEKTANVFVKAAHETP